MRKLNSLSAILENADDQFDSLRESKERYMQEISGIPLEKGNFDLNQELNLDSLQAFLDFYFPDRTKHLEFTPELLDEILKYNKKGKGNISFKTIADANEKYKPDLEIDDLVNSGIMVKEDAKNLRMTDFKKYKEISDSCKYFNQIGATRYVLERYFEDYSDYLAVLKKKSYNCGQKPGIGRYICTNCGKDLFLSDNTDILPPCAHCKNCKFTKYEVE